MSSKSKQAEVLADTVGAIVTRTGNIVTVDWDTGNCTREQIDYPSWTEAIDALQREVDAGGYADAPATAHMLPDTLIDPTDAGRELLDDAPIDEAPPASAGACPGAQAPTPFTLSSKRVQHVAYFPRWVTKPGEGDRATRNAITGALVVGVQGNTVTIARERGTFDDHPMIIVNEDYAVPGDMRTSGGRVQLTIDASSIKSAGDVRALVVALLVGTGLSVTTPEAQGAIAARINAKDQARLRKALEPSLMLLLSHIVAGDPVGVALCAPTTIAGAIQTPLEHQASEARNAGLVASDTLALATANAIEVVNTAQELCDAGDALQENRLQAQRDALELFASILMPEVVEAPTVGAVA